MTYTPFGCGFKASQSTTAFVEALEATKAVNTSFQATVSEVTLYRVAGGRPIAFSVRL